MDIFSFIQMFGGLALFLYGMEEMGSGLKSSSGSALKRVLEKTTNNPLAGFAVGLIVTAIIQSSTATVVLVVGLVNAGVMTFRQSINVVLGANVGTTVTAQIIRLMDVDGSSNSLMNFFKPATLAPVAAIAGIILIMFVKSKTAKNAGTIAMGFAILFFGLLNMTAAVEPLAASPVFVSIIQKFSAVPILGFLAGLVITVIVQSSSASVGMLQALSATGVITFGSAYAIVLGQNIGSCVTTGAISSIGSNRDAKRTGLVHILSNSVGTIVVMIVFTLIRHAPSMQTLFGHTMSSGDIANFHTIFNVFMSALIMPFTGAVDRLCHWLIKDEEDETTKEERESGLAKLEDSFFVNPSIAVYQTADVVGNMAKLCRKNFVKSMQLFDEFKPEKAEKIQSRESLIDKMSDRIENYLVRLSPHITTDRDNVETNFLIQIVSEFERIGDYSINILERAEQLHEEKLKFSPAAQKELALLTKAVTEILDITIAAMRHNDPDEARRVEPLEEIIDELVKSLKDRHIYRLKNNLCSTGAGIVFLNMLADVERVSDHCSNIALYELGKHSGFDMDQRHEYKRQLHKGTDEFYNKAYEQNEQTYLNALKQIDPADQSCDVVLDGPADEQAAAELGPNEDA